MIDAAVQLDAPLDAPNPGQHCFMGFFNVCIDPGPGDRTFAGTVEIDTMMPTAACTFVQPQAQAPNVCVIVGNNIIVAPGATVRLVGPLPVAFVAYDTITISGTVDASSRLAGRRGAGSGTGPCNIAQQGTKATQTIAGGGGGAAGALGFDGGKGGVGTGGSGGGITTMRVSNNNLLWIRGGCAGANGGTNSNGQGAGVAGHGGGAVHFVARVAVELASTAVINASGSAGAPAGLRGGGGGGGSGGFIGFQAPMFSTDPGAQVFAVGGGGSAGGGNSAAGVAGNEATGPGATLVATGMGGGGNGGIGTPGIGDAGTGGIPAGGGTAGGGGGGGGGGGRIGAQGGTFMLVTAPPVTGL